MCGIFGMASDLYVRSNLLLALDLLQYRGYDSYGIAISSEKKIQVKKSVGNEDSIAVNLGESGFDGCVGIAHSRWATHGNVNLVNSHPHASNHKVAIVHNGIIENYLDLQSSLLNKSDDYTFASQTDSEVIAHLIDDALKSNPEINLLQSVKIVVSKLKGSFSFAAISLQNPELIIAATNKSSLVVGTDGRSNYISSDSATLSSFANKICRLNENSICILSKKSIEAYDFELNKLFLNFTESNLGCKLSFKNNFKTYMMKEIMEQPEVVRNSISGRIDFDHQIDQPKEDIFLAKNIALLSKVKSIKLVACGTSYHAALLASYWYEEHLGVSCSAHISSEFIYKKNVVPEDCLFISLSQSGETADTISAVDIANGANYLAVMTICNLEGSTIAAKSDMVYLMRAGVEVSVASTKAFVAQLVSLLTLMRFIAHVKKKDNIFFAKLASELKSLPHLIESTLAYSDDVFSIAKTLVNQKNIIFSGRKEQYPISMEAALKLKEISYINAESYPLGEFKHGSLALIEEGVHVVISISNNSIQDKVFSNIQEILSRNGTVLLFHDSAIDIKISHKNLKLFPFFVSSEILFPILSVVPFQLLACFVSEAKGFNPDKPRNLAKSVTVE